MNYRFSSNENYSRSNYNDETLTNAGLDLQISEKINLTDLLRVEYKIEATYQFIHHYIKSIAPKDFIVMSNIPSDLNLWEHSRILILMENWKLFLLEKDLTNIKITCVSFTDDFTDEIVKIEDSIPSKSKIETIKITLTEDYPKSYCIALAAKLIFKDQHILSSEEITEEGILIIIEEIANFIYISSKIPAKKLLFGLQEAKSLFYVPSSKSDSDKGDTDRSGRSSDSFYQENSIPLWAQRDYLFKKPATTSISVIVQKSFFKVLEKPLIDLLTIHPSKHFQCQKSYQIKLELDTDIIEEEADKGDSLSDTPLAIENSYLFTFESENESHKNQLVTCSSDLEYSHSDDQSDSTQRLSDMITPFNLSVVDRLPKIYSDSLTLSESSNIQQFSQDQTNRKSVIDYNETLEFYPVEVVDIIQKSPKIKKRNVIQNKTPLDSPKECNLSIQDIQKQFALMDSRITMETVDATLKSEISEFGKGSVLPVSRVDFIAYSSYLEGRTSRSEDGKLENCKCSRCLVF